MPRASKPDSRKLLTWYDRARRALPWRFLPGQTPDPYVVWLSEIMLQQTTVAAVGDYFKRFITRWPTVEALAEAKLDDILKEWAGLGYYARARNLHKCARVVANEHGGQFPDTEEALRALPGIGPYTAAAIAAIAFDRKATVVDGNVERVISRVFAVEALMPAAKPEIRRLAATLTPDERSGDFAQAMMDLGATVCTPRSPKCDLCPWTASCAARKAGNMEDYPRRAPKTARPLRRGVCFWIEDSKGRVFVRTRPEKGLLGGMTEFPGTEWVVCTSASPPVIPGVVRHTFTHFDLELEVQAMRLSGPGPKTPEGRWVTKKGLEKEALPSVMRKVMRHALLHFNEKDAIIPPSRARRKAG